MSIRNYIHSSRFLTCRKDNVESNISPTRLNPTGTGVESRILFLLTPSVALWVIILEKPILQFCSVI